MSCKEIPYELSRQTAGVKRWKVQAFKATIFYFLLFVLSKA
jgi:hypothetical protein